MRQGTISSSNYGRQHVRNNIRNYFNTIRKSILNYAALGCINL